MELQGLQSLQELSPDGAASSKTLRAASDIDITGDSIFTQTWIVVPLDKVFDRELI